METVLASPFNIVEIITNMRRNRFPLSKIAEVCGVSRQRIHQIAKAHHIVLERRYQKDAPMPARWLWKNLSYRASGKARIDLYDALVNKLPSHCPILETKLIYALAGRSPSENTPSIDRVDNSKGYIPSNVSIISRRANMLKSDATRDILIRLVEYMDSSND